MRLWIVLDFALVRSFVRWVLSFEKVECFYLIYDIWDIYETPSGFFIPCSFLSSVCPIRWLRSFMGLRDTAALHSQCLNSLYVLQFLSLSFPILPLCFMCASLVCSRVCYNLLVSFVTCSILFVWRETVKIMSRNYQTIQHFFFPLSLFNFCFCCNTHIKREQMQRKKSTSMWKNMSPRSSKWSFGCFVVLQFNFMLLLPSMLEICFDASPHFRLLFKSLNIFAENQVKMMANKERTRERKKDSA